MKKSMSEIKQEMIALKVKLCNLADDEWDHMPDDMKDRVDTTLHYLDQVLMGENPVTVLNEIKKNNQSVQIPKSTKKKHKFTLKQIGKFARNQKRQERK